MKLNSFGILDVVEEPRKSARQKRTTSSFALVLGFTAALLLLSCSAANLAGSKSDLETRVPDPRDLGEHWGTLSPLRYMADLELFKCGGCMNPAPRGSVASASFRNSITGATLDIVVTWSPMARRFFMELKNGMGSGDRSSPSPRGSAVVPAPQMGTIDQFGYESIATVDHVLVYYAECNSYVGHFTLGGMASSTEGLRFAMTRLCHPR